MGLWANIPRVEAGRFRKAASLHGIRLTVDQVYDLALAETGSEERASRIASDYASELLRSGQMAE